MCATQPTLYGLSTKTHTFAYHWKSLSHNLNEQRTIVRLVSTDVLRLRRLGDIFSSGCSLLFVDRAAVDPRGSCLLPLMFLYLATSLLFTGFCPSINYCSQLLTPSTLWRDSNAREMYANVSLLLKFPRSSVPERRRRSFSSLFQVKEKGRNARRNEEYVENLTRIRINKHNNILSLTFRIHRRIFKIHCVLGSRNIIHSDLVRSASEERQDFAAKSRRWLAQMLLIRVAEVKGSFVHTFVHYDQKPCPCIQVRQNGSPLGLSVPRLHPGSPVRRTKTSSRGSQTDLDDDLLRQPAKTHCDESASQKRKFYRLRVIRWYRSFFSTRSI